MAWPTPQDYNEAVQSPQHCFSDPELKSGHVEINAMGLPRPISGRFAVVYQMSCGSRKYAVRCFQGQVPDQALRYTAISKHLAESQLPYTVKFEFQEEGILIGGHWYPILKMEWVSGEPLNVYVERNLHSPAALSQLAEKWMIMAAAVQNASLAHGDLQDGNVLVINGELKLIDYDGMYVPALAGRTSDESGHRNYQHPNRTASDYDLYLDNFSNWVVWLSLFALSVDPSLWKQLDGGDECLLFRKQDYMADGASKALTAFTRHRDVRLQTIALVFQSMLYLPPSQVPALGNSPLIDTSSTSTFSIPNSGTAAWWQDHVSTDQSVRSPSAANVSQDANSGAHSSAVSPSWIFDFIAPPTNLKTFDIQLSKPRSILTANVALMALLPMAHSSFLSEAIGETFLTLLLGAISYVFYERTPLSQEKQLYVGQERTHRKDYSSLEQQVRYGDQQIVSLRKKESDAKVAAERQWAEIQKRERQAQAKVSNELQNKMNAILARQNQLQQTVQKRNHEHLKRVDSVNQQAVQCNQQQASEISAQLHQIQQKFVQDFLYSARIENARLQGIGPKMAANLRAAGYVTAADVNWGVQNVSGIGGSKASTLLGWRQSVLNNANAKQPTALDRNQVSAIASKYDGQRAVLQRQIEEEKTQHDQREATFQQQTAKTHASLNAERAAAQDDFQKKMQETTDRFRPEYDALPQGQVALAAEVRKGIAEIENEILQVRKSMYDQNWKLAKSRQELDAYKNINFRSYLKALLNVRSA